jgi:hypothetical protein
MQLRLTIDELLLLDEILQESAREFRERAAQANSSDAQRRFALDRAMVDDLLAKVGVRDLRFSADEFDGLSDLLGIWEWRIFEQISRCEDAVVRSSLERQMSGLRGLRDKVTEACAMV